MLYALDKAGKKISPTLTGQRAICEICGNIVLSRCGSIVSWHWAHSTDIDCDPWYEHMTEWHKSWQEYLSIHKAELEVVIEHNGIKHRADAVLPNGTVVELQHSSLSVEEIQEREVFYGKSMVWVFDITSAYEADRFLLRRDIGENTTFRWKHPRKSVAYTKRKTYLDLGDGEVFRLKKMYPDAPCGGIGKHIRSIKLMAFHNVEDN